jgi:hypothetical protein
MPTSTIDERIKSLHERVKGANAAAKARLQHQFDDLYREQEDLKSKVEVAEHSVDAELSESQRKFEEATEALIESWDFAVERLQTTAASLDGESRRRAESAITELRTRRNAVVAALDAVRRSTGDSWREQKKHVLAAADEFGRKLSEWTEKIRGGDGV